MPFLNERLVDLCILDGDLTGVQPMWSIERLRRRKPGPLEGRVLFLDTRPLFHGHVLLVPRVHVETLPDLPAE